MRPSLCCKPNVIISLSAVRAGDAGDALATQHPLANFFRENLNKTWEDLNKT